MKTGLVACCAAAIAVSVATFAPTRADAGCWGCAVGAGVFGGLACLRGEMRWSPKIEQVFKSSSFLRRTDVHNGQTETVFGGVQGESGS